MLYLCAIASGSSGNAILIYNETTTLLIDAGISAKRICDGLALMGRSPSDLDGICVTHAHSDHISGLRVLLKKTDAPLYATDGTGQALLRETPGAGERLREIRPGADFAVGDLGLSAFSTPHDAEGSVGYCVTDGQRRCSVVTDLGFVTEEVRRGVLGSHLALVEANHDVDWLMSGPYPPYLKRRIRGDLGHLSNEDGGALCCDLAEHGAHTLILGHLSRQNNTPERARQVVGHMLRARGYDGVALEVASHQVCSPAFEV
ncbi:MAG: MBL fold metallo-hydrolase [Oscillospiraceae bacterium]|nr:MBL fold metallo-hydrolase [Oscillospiraceae bacterium]